MCDSKVESRDVLPSGLLPCACLACFAVDCETAFAPSAVFSLHSPYKLFCFRGTAGTAIKCAYGLFQILQVGREGAGDKDAETRPEGQQIPRAHKSSCALFLCLNRCLPPFEARLASRFAAAD